MDELALIEAARQGDVPAFNQLVLRYQGKAYSVAFRILGEGATAEDVTQEAFLAAYRAIRTLRGGSFRAWLLRIVVNKCRDQIRTVNRHSTLSVDASLIDPDHLSYMATRGESPIEAIRRQALTCALQEAILTLQPDYRTALVLVDVQGLHYREVAEVLGIPMGTVRSRISRARAQLRDQLLARQDILPARVYRTESALLEHGMLGADTGTVLP